MFKAIEDGVCERPNEKYDDSVLCTRALRPALFRNFLNEVDFRGQPMKTYCLNEGLENVNETNAYGISEDFKIMNKPSKDASQANVVILPTGYTYNIHWGTGIDWDHTLLVPSPYAEESD